MLRKIAFTHFRFLTLFGMTGFLGDIWERRCDRLWRSHLLSPLFNNNYCHSEQSEESHLN